MKTMIQGGYIVGFDGKGHWIIPDGVVVFADDRIIQVGKSYDGQVDQTIDAKGKLVGPGFINIHAWAIIDVPLRLDSSWAVLAVSKAYAVDGEGELDLVGEDLQTSALFGLASLLKGGSTTSVTITGMAPSRWESPKEQAEVLAKTAGELGARAYISHQYRSGVKYRTREGAIRYHWNEDAGRDGLARAIQFAEKFEGSYDDRIRTMLFPYQLDTCSAELLQETKK
ncbi:MAG: hypothetical protein FJY85_25610, partial [Deltaproteobacteria bacterium]|nr:hypothetical protein [Deltaproteobacteria bacterium]